jgi:hypothetical protein
VGRDEEKRDGRGGMRDGGREKRRGVERGGEGDVRRRTYLTLRTRTLSRRAPLAVAPRGRE